MSTQEFNQQLTEKFNLSTQQIDALNRLGVNDPTDLVHVTEENLTGCGVPLITARKVLAHYKGEQKPTAAVPAPTPTPAQAPAPAAPVDQSAMMQQILAMMATSQAGTNNALSQLANSLTAQNSVACGSCGAMIPKEYQGEICPECGGMLSTGISQCAICETAVPATIKNAKRCVNPECRAHLVEGDDADAMRYLINTGESVRSAEEALSKAKAEKSPDLKVWVTQGRKLSGPVIRTTRQAKDAAQNMSAQQFSTQRRAGIEVRW